MANKQQETCSYSFCCLAGALISFQLTPNHIRGIALHFLTLSYGGGCFLGAFIIQLMYFLSGGKIQTNKQENTNTGLTNDIEALVLNTVVLCYRKLLPKHTA